MRFLCGICQCVVAGEYVNVCGDCLEAHGLNPKPMDEWPAWAQFAVRNEWRRRNRQRRDGDAEFGYGTYADLESLLDGLED